MDDLHQTKRLYRIKRIYKSDHGTLLGLPKKLATELDLNNKSYVRMWYDRTNGTILLSKLEDDGFGENKK